MSFAFSRDGVSLAGFKRLLDERGDKNIEGKSTYTVAMELIKPKAKKKSYLDFLRKAAPEEVGKANLFVSHALEGNFQQFFDSVTSFCSSKGMKDDETFLCLDILCFDLNDEDPIFIGLAEAYKNLFSKVKQAIFIIDDFENPIFMKRMWCIFDFIQCLKCKIRYIS